MAAKGLKKVSGAPKGVTPINTPYWAPGWGGNRANVPTPFLGPAWMEPGKGWASQPWLWSPPEGVPPMSPGYGAYWIPSPEAIAPTTPTIPTTPAAPTSATPNVPAYNPQPNPYTLGAGVGNVPAQTQTQGQSPIPEGYQYPYWLEESTGRPAYKWELNPETGNIELMPNEYAFTGAPTPELDAEGNPWSSVYSKDFYSTQAPKQYQWLSVSSNGGTMASAGWRRPGRYYIPDQRVTRAGPDGPVTAERPPKPSRRGDDGNNQNLSIPAWVGSLVSWRT